MITFELEISLGAQIVETVELPLNNPVILGADDTCEVVLAGDRVKARHAELKHIDSQWRISALDGEVRIAGEVVDDTQLELNQVVALGPYILKITLAKAREDWVLSDQAQAPKTSKRWYDLAHNQFQQLLKFKSKDSETVEQEQSNSAVGSILNKLWSPERRLRTGLVIVIAVLTVFVFGFDSSEPVKVTDEKPSYDVQTLRDIERYSAWVDELLQAGDYSQALTILNAAVTKRPHVIELQQQREAVVEQFVDHIIETGEFDSASAITKSFSGDEYGPSIRKSRDKLDKVLKERQLHLASYEKNKQQFDATVVIVKTKIAAGELDEAQLLLHDLVEISEFEPLWKKELIVLREQLNESALILDQEREQQHQKALADRRVAIDFFNQCLANYEQGDVMQAYNDCQRAKQKFAIAGLSAEIQVWLNILEPVVTQQMNTWNNRAEECFRTGWVGCALGNWEKMRRHDPENTQLQARVNSVIERQRKIALNLFNEARAYVDLGRERDALIVLKELQQELPIETEDIYQKASAMINRLQ